MSVTQKRTIRINYESDLGTYEVLRRIGDILELRHLPTYTTFHARMDDEGLLTDESWQAISHMTRLIYEAHGFNLK